MPKMPALLGGPIAGSGPSQSGFPSARFFSGQANFDLMGLRFSTFQ
jgi:hypothetical protein